MMDIDVETPSFRTNQRKRRWTGTFDRPRSVYAEDSDSESDSFEPFEPETDIPEAAPRRSTRRRFRAASPPKSAANRGVKPKKLTEKSSLKDVENYYLDKKVKRLNPSLETIFEASETNSEDATVMSTRKYKRLIEFKPPTVKNSTKAKKRKMKAKMVNSKRNKKLSLKVLMDKLAEVSD